MIIGCPKKRAPTLIDYLLSSYRGIGLDICTDVAHAFKYHVLKFQSDM